MFMKYDWVTRAVVNQKSGLHTERSAVSAVLSLACDAKRSRRTASRERNSSTPIYAPHMRRIPVNVERPWSTRWLSIAAQGNVSSATCHFEIVDRKK